MMQTLAPALASAAARLTLVVVLPTPPFWFITAIVRIVFLSSSLCSHPSCGGFSSSEGLYETEPSCVKMSQPPSRIEVTRIKHLPGGRSTRPALRGQSSQCFGVFCWMGRAANADKHCRRLRKQVNHANEVLGEEAVPSHRPRRGESIPYGNAAAATELR